MFSSQPTRVFGNLATTGDRFVAVLIDSIIVYAAVALVAIPVGLFGIFGFGFFFGLLWGAFAFLGWLVGLLYFSFFEGTSGQTLGKQLVGIKVVDEVTTRPPPMEQALLRNILRIIDSFLFYLVGFILIETQPNKKRLGDIVAKTIVVKA
jgi:uncharacterized RDD family membrane protein YckC